MAEIYTFGTPAHAIMHVSNERPESGKKLTPELLKLAEQINLLTAKQPFSTHTADDYREAVNLFLVMHIPNDSTAKVLINAWLQQHWNAWDYRNNRLKPENEIPDPNFALPTLMVIHLLLCDLHLLGHELYVKLPVPVEEYYGLTMEKTKNDQL